MTFVLSLFPGLGLLDMAFEREGFCVVRGPDVLWGGDVRSFHPPAGVFAGVIGGPPCQTFSPLANLVRAKGYEPRFGNLIPEFERCVAEAVPEWFLMEEVPQAPVANVHGYSVKAFTLDNSSLDAGDGLGHEQERLRMFSFGVHHGRAKDLRRWIQLAALRLPRAGTVTTTHVNNTPEAKGRVGTVVWNAAPGQRTPTVHGGNGDAHRLRQEAVTSDPRPTSSRVRRQAVTSCSDAVPVKLGGSGKLKPGARVPAVVGAHGAAGRPKGGHLVVYRWEEMLRLQGLPPDFLEHAPFTVEGKRKAVANGVPLPMGRALARAVKAATAPACDCECPDPADGLALISNDCEVHG